MTAFKDFGKIARLNRDIIITEKLDGTNAVVIITEHLVDGPGGGAEWDGTYDVTAQSRTRIITPDKSTDNYGFDAWVEANREGLKLLGPGHHYGEWYGQSIQRNYGLPSRRFALFNVLRWHYDEEQAKLFQQAREQVTGLELVPVLYRGPWLDPADMRGDGLQIDITEAFVGRLKNYGSVAVPGWMQPEGIVVYHTASKQLYKVTCEKREGRGVQGCHPGHAQPARGAS